MSPLYMNTEPIPVIHPLPPIDPPWIVEAKKHIGEREIPGPAVNSWINSLWAKIKRGGIKGEDTPWCAAFANAMLEDAGIISTRFESAKSFLTWGVKLDRPAYGCIAVFERQGGGHVGFVVGKDKFNSLLILGGNQGDAVSIAAFSWSRLSGFRWPQGQQHIKLAEPPVLLSFVPRSIKES